MSDSIGPGVHTQAVFWELAEDFSASLQQGLMVCFAQQQNTTEMCMAMFFFYFFFHNRKHYTPTPAMHIAIRPENKAGYQGKNYYRSSDSENHFPTCFHFEIPFKRFI